MDIAAAALSRVRLLLTSKLAKRPSLPGKPNSECIYRIVRTITPMCIRTGRVMHTTITMGMIIITTLMTMTITVMTTIITITTITTTTTTMTIITGMITAIMTTRLAAGTATLTMIDKWTVTGTNNRVGSSSWRPGS